MERKKLRIVTWFNGLNFGTGLQAFALQRKLVDSGYKARLLVVQDNCKYDWHYYCWAIEDCIGLNRLRHEIMDHIFHKKIFHPREKTSRKWIRRYIRPEVIRFKFEMRRLLSTTSCFITGSDIIWNAYHGYFPSLFLQFAEGCKKIAYSSSIGTDDVNPDYADRIRKHLACFAHIGVREETAVRALSRLTGRTDIVRVLDPVFLLSKVEWNSVLDRSHIKRLCPSQKPYVLCYLLGQSPHYADQVGVVMKRTGLKNIVVVQAWENKEFTLPGVTRLDDYSPLQFLDILRNASYVCTDSFHCSAFSIIYNKPFTEFERFAVQSKTASNSKTTDLLRLFGLQSRIYSENASACFGSFDYVAVNQKLEKERESSLAYLLGAIEH